MVGYCVKNHGEFGNCITACYAVTNGTKFAATGNPQIEASYNCKAVKNKENKLPIARGKCPPQAVMTRR
jgi:hypothetical protein